MSVVALLLALPAVAQAKAGIEFDNGIELQQPGDRQTFSALVMNEPTDPMGGEPKPIAGVRPLVTFRSDSTGAVIRVRVTRTDATGVGSGSVVFPDRGPWTTRLSVNGKSFGRGNGQTFQLAPAPAAPADSQPARTDSGDGGLPAWLLTLPIAALVALGIWFVRRHPRELGA